MNIYSGDSELIEEIFDVDSDTFKNLSLRIFNFQYEHNAVYRQYCDVLRTDLAKVNCLEKIPFLPIQFFKSKIIMTTDFSSQEYFESSGTTGSINSKHFVKDLSLYRASFLKGFNKLYGDVKAYCIIGLLPSYLEKGHSSLVYMVNELIVQSTHPRSDFYLHDHEKLYKTLLENEFNGQPTLLIGVTYALLDFSERYRMRLKHTIVMETGGMKGRRDELTREEIHEQLKQRLGVNEVHSEYGMTELLSQAYSKAAGIFNSPPWMKILLRADDDPFQIILPDNINGFHQSGAVNIIDLANLFSCCFIATDDAGRLYKDESFEILGRLDNSDIRGCSLMTL